uniref:transcription factor NF-E2 45 kDa subunit-like isoform X2 n=1 Tax=Myxine glutinosa TaxID=7769 RepID=UPI00358F560B
MMELSEILWRQDVDLGVAREAFDEVERSKRMRWELEEQREHERTETQDQKQEAGEQASFEVDHETGELLTVTLEPVTEQPESLAVQSPCLELVKMTGAPRHGALTCTSSEPPIDLEQQWQEILSLNELQGMDADGVCSRMQQVRSDNRVDISTLEACPALKCDDVLNAPNDVVSIKLEAMDNLCPAMDALNRNTSTSEHELLDSDTVSKIRAISTTICQNSFQADDPLSELLYSAMDGEDMEIHQSKGQSKADDDFPWEESFFPAGICAVPYLEPSKGSDESRIGWTLMKSSDSGSVSDGADCNTSTPPDLDSDSIPFPIPRSPPNSLHEEDEDSSESGTMSTSFSLRSSRSPDDYKSTGKAKAQTFMAARASKMVARPSRDQRRTDAMKIPFSVSDVVGLPVDSFGRLLARHSLSDVQLALVRDIRRRGKNKVAAQNCRRRKMQSLASLEGEIEALHTERTCLQHQKERLSTTVQTARTALANLRKRVFANLRDEHGSPYSPEKYTLEHTHDGVVFLVPRQLPGKPWPK